MGDRVVLERVVEVLLADELGEVGDLLAHARSLFPLALCQIVAQVRPGEAVHGIAVGLAARKIAAHPADADPAGGVDVAHVIVIPDVQDDVFRGKVLLGFHAHRTPVGLIDAVTADAEVPDRLAEMGREGFLPGFAVADLGALGVTVAVGVDPARLIRVVDHAAVLAAGIISAGGPHIVHAVLHGVIAVEVAEFGVKFEDGGLLGVQVTGDFLRVVGVSVE